MTAKSFADSNVVLYTIGKDVRKADIARALLAEYQAVSVQVVNECVSVCLRKLSFTREQAYAFARTLMDRTEVLSLDESTVDQTAALDCRTGTRSSWRQLCLPAVKLSIARTYKTAKSLRID